MRSRVRFSAAETARAFPPRRIADYPCVVGQRLAVVPGRGPATGCETRIADIWQAELRARKGGRWSAAVRSIPLRALRVITGPGLDDRGHRLTVQLAWEPS